MEKKMWKIELTCTEDIGRAVLRLFDSMETIAGDAWNEENVTFQVDKDPRPPRDIAPRVQYRALLPTGRTTSQLMALIEANVAELGGKSVKAIVYQDVATATVGGRGLNEKEITRTRHFASKSTQRALVELRQASLVLSEPIVRTAAD